MKEDLAIARFSSAEYQRRHMLAAGMLAEGGLEALVVYGNSYKSSDVRWVSGFSPRHDTFLIWPASGQPTLLTLHFNHVPTAQRVSHIADTRWGGTDIGSTAAQILREKGVVRGRVGLVGSIPYRNYLTLASAFPEVQFMPRDKDFQVLRLVKSEEEIRWIRKAAAFTDVAMAALAQAAAMGVSEHQLVAAIECAYLGAGGEHNIHFMSATPMDNPGSFVPDQTHTSRCLQIGDVIINEIGAGWGGYKAQVHRAFAVGREPTPVYQRLYRVAREVHDGIVGLLRAGVAIGQALDIAERIEREGLTICDDLIHGYGMGIEQPVIRTRATAHGPQDESLVFHENSVLIVQPNVVDEATGAGLQIGNTILIRAGTAETLTSYPMEFTVLAH